MYRVLSQVIMQDARHRTLLLLHEPLSTRGRLGTGGILPKRARTIIGLWLSCAHTHVFDYWPTIPSDQSLADALKSEMHLKLTTSLVSWKQ